MTTTTTITTTPIEIALPMAWTWQRLVEVEPRLHDVERLTRSVYFDGGDNFVWVLSRLLPLVGEFARRPELRTSIAWTVASNHLKRIFERRPRKDLRL